MQHSRPQSRTKERAGRGLAASTSSGKIRVIPYHGRSIEGRRRVKPEVRRGLLPTLETNLDTASRRLGAGKDLDRNVLALVARSLQAHPIDTGLEP